MDELERLRLAFEDLESEGIVAIAHAALDMTNGMADVRSEELRWRDLGRLCRGYCFYHSQDIEAAIESGVLHLAWGALSATASDVRAIALSILETLARHDLTASWSGDVRRRIVVEVESPGDAAAWPPMFEPGVSPRQQVIDDATDRLRDAIEVADDQAAWRALLAAGQPQDALNCALLMAARWGRTRASADLLTGGADPAWQEEDGSRRTALHAAIEGALSARRAASAGIPVPRSYADYLELIRLLVKAMPRLDHRNAYGLTAIDEARDAGAMELVHILEQAT